MIKIIKPKCETCDDTGFYRLIGLEKTQRCEWCPAGATTLIIPSNIHTPIIETRPREAHEIVQFLRAHGWVYIPFSRLSWYKDKEGLSVLSAGVALAIELGESVVVEGIYR